MKNILLLLTALVIAVSGMAQKAPTTKLVSSSENKIVVNVQLNGYSLAKVQTPQGEQLIVNVPEMATMLEAGSPDLPTLPIPVIIGDCAEMNVNVIDAQYTDYPYVDIAPSKGNISRQINPDDVPYTYGEMYQQNAFWPATQAYLEAPYILRDFRGQNIMVRPFAYNPQSHTLRVYDNLTIEMTKVSDNGVNVKAPRKSDAIKVDMETQHAYSRRFLNYGQATAKYNFLNDQGELLVICADQFLEGMEEFVAWKNESGRPTTLVSVTEVGGNNDNAIKNYITSIYNDPDRNLQFVLFVGDYEHITPHSIGSERSDNWFGQLEGGDHYPEVFIGRFSVQTDQHVATQVNKVLYYERDMGSNVAWTNKGLGIGYIGAGSGHYGEDDYQHIDLIRDTLIHYTYETVTELHGGGGGASANSISSTINQGVGIINYCNHGSETSWGVANYSNSNVNALTNDNMLPIVWSVACLNGKFNYGTDCFAEAWMRAINNSNGTPTGAIGGMFSWMSQPWTPPMYGQDEMVAILTEWRGGDLFHHTLAGASLNGNMNVIDMTGNYGYDTHDTWILFGDPSLLVRTDIPTEMTVSVNPSTLLLGMSELSVNADTEFGIATLSMNGEIIASANVVNGTAELTFPGLSNVGNAVLTVIGYNKVTYRDELEVIPAVGPYLVLDSYSINEGQPVNFAEEGTVELTFKNVGVEDAQNITVSVSTDCEYIDEIYNSTIVIEAVNTGEVVDLPEAIRFAVANNVPDQTKAQFNVELTSGDHVWNSSFMVILNAPAIELQSSTLLGTYHAGETGILELVFVNNGHSQTPAVTMGITSASNDITLTEIAFTHEGFGQGDTITFQVEYTIAEGVEEGSCYEIDYVLNADHYSISGATAISVGNVSDGFESGDYQTFTWSFQGNQPWIIDDNPANAYEGSYCARSGAITHNQTSSLILTVDLPTDGEISFYKKVSSEANYDKLTFFIDGASMTNWSGILDWTEETYPLSAGQHTLKWTYAKDVSQNSGSDCAWIDNITLPPTCFITSLNPVENLEATVEENTVRLDWETDERVVNYTILRNGEEVGTTEETFFEEEVEQGVYTYTVIYHDNDGLASMPAYVTVNVTSFLSVAEGNEGFAVYPNPTAGVLNIQFNGAYSYTLFNNYGQQVMNGKANGNHQLNLGGLAKGVYLLNLNNGQQIQKVIVR